MKAATIRRFQTVHTWTGLLAGFALFVAFYAGALTVFHDEIVAWQNPPWRAAPDARVSTDALIESLLAHHPETRGDFGIVLPDGGGSAYAYWLDKGAARFATASQMDAPAAEAGDGNLADFVYALHDSLGLPVVGLYLMGLVSVLYGLALVSGFLIHLPQLLGDLFALRAGRNLKRLWQDAHNAIGVLSLPFHVIFALTGAIFCLSAITLFALNTISFDGKLFGLFAQATATAPATHASGVASAMLPPEQLRARARIAALAEGVTRFDPSYLHYTHYGDRNAVVEVLGLSQHTLGTYGTVALSARDGSVLAMHVGDAQDANQLSWSALYALHFGNFGGDTVRWLYFVLGLAGAFLFYSGNLLWVESRRKRRHADQPLRTRVMARATVGVCIGSCLGISGAFGAALACSQLGIDAAVPQRVACYGLFLAACAWACARPVARAAAELLGATAVLTAAVAIADLVGNAGHWMQPWTPATRAVLGVDLTGIVLAIAFAGLARAALRRGRDGDPHSVWALPAPDTI